MIQKAGCFSTTAVRFVIWFFINTLWLMQCLEYWAKSVTHYCSALFQQCCYGRRGQLLTTPSFEAGSALLYNPRFYRSLHYRYDLQPKEWCCLFSDNCDLYYRVRPLDRCFGYIFPRFSEYSMMTTTTIIVVVIIIIIIIIIITWISGLSSLTLFFNLWNLWI